MIRISHNDCWRLISHADHARLAGAIASHWGNGTFTRPEPFEAILEGICRHDDAWEGPDSTPNLTPVGEPAGFSKNLVGAYSAFENIDLADYLKVRGEATEAVAADQPFAAVLVSMHTVNLLTEQADLSSLSAGDREMHARFITRQRERQAELVGEAKLDPAFAPHTDPASLDIAFRLLQACDSLSLVICSQYPDSIDLRHAHPTAAGREETIRCTPMGRNHYRLQPYPFDTPSLTFDVPHREICLPDEADVETLRRIYTRTEPGSFQTTLTA